MSSDLASGHPPRLGAPVVRIGEVESTNDFARLLAVAGAPEGVVVIAHRQTRGRGRRGRVWVSPPGGLWCSLVLRPSGQEAFGRLSLTVAVAAAEAIERVAQVHVGIAWPNDLIIHSRKVGGILLEGVPNAVVVGIGINANVPIETMPEEVASRATSLHLSAGGPVECEELLECLLARLSDRYAAWAAGDPAALGDWASRDLTRGTRVTVSSPGRIVEGIADGIDEDGALRVRVDSGAVERVVAGDLTSMSERRPPSAAR